LLDDVLSADVEIFLYVDVAAVEVVFYLVLVTWTWLLSLTKAGQLS
jgi:hypothetical protein